MLVQLSKQSFMQGSQQFLFKCEMAINLIYSVLSQACMSKLKEHILHCTAKQQLPTNLINKVGLQSDL